MTAQQAPQVVRDAIATITDDELAYLAYLRERWQDEREYEDWNDYATAIKRRFSRWVITRVTNRPIGFIFRVLGHDVHVKFQFRGGTVSLLYRWTTN